MTDRTFTGLIIGGPSAGTWVTHNAPAYTVVERAPMDFRELVRPDDMVEVAKTFVYKHIIGFRHRVDGRWSDDVLNFWIPWDKEWNPLDCVRMMAEDYASYHDLRNS